MSLGELWPTFRWMIMSAKAQRSFETAITIYWATASQPRKLESQTSSFLRIICVFCIVIVLRILCFSCSYLYSELFVFPVVIVLRIVCVSCSYCTQNCLCFL